MKRSQITDKMRADTQMYCDRDTEIRCATVRIVTARKAFSCPTCNKKKAAGTRAYSESAIVDGQWERANTCIDCVDKWIMQTDGACVAGFVP